MVLLFLIVFSKKEKYPERSRQLKAARADMQVVFDKMNPNNKNSGFGKEIDGTIQQFNEFTLKSDTFQLLSNAHNLHSRFIERRKERRTVAAIV